MTRNAWLLAIVGFLPMLVAPASAHHAGAMFDSTKTVTMSGTVKDFEWTNPHAWIEMVASDGAGQGADWKIECSAVNIIARKGWAKTSLKPGDKVTIMVHPLRDGSPGGLIMNVTLADGSTLTDHDY